MVPGRSCPRKLPGNGILCTGSNIGNLGLAAGIVLAACENRLFVLSVVLELVDASTAG